MPRKFMIRSLLVFFTLLLVEIVIFIRQSSLITDINLLTATPTPPTHRDLWNSRGGPNYEMIVEVIAFSPPVAQALTIKDGKIVKNSIIACDNPSDEYPAWACEAVKTYYGPNGLYYTIDGLFDIADSSLSRTREAVGKCRAVNISTFQDFPNANAMFEIEKTCEVDLDRLTLSAIEYDPYYGYPNKITSTVPGISDGTSTITVKDFRLTE